MAIFADSEQLYACTQALFARLEREDPDAARDIRDHRLIIRLDIHQPSAEITINGRLSPVQTLFGPTGLRPDLNISLAADDLHRILLGDLSLRSALGARRLKVRGPVLEALALADLFHRLQAIYPEVRQAQGLG